MQTTPSSRAPTWILLLLPALLACPKPGGSDAGNDEAEASETDSSSESETSMMESSSSGSETDTTTESDTTTETDTTTDTDTDTDTGVEQACPCIEDEPGDPGDYEPKFPTCRADSCPLTTATLTTEGWGETGDPVGFELTDPDALLCALEALRDRSPKMMRWGLDIDFGWASDAGYVFIRDDELAIRRSWNWEDLGGEVGDAVLGSLKSPDFFQACIDDPDDEARFNCLRNPLETTMQVCDEGWWTSSL